MNLQELKKKTPSELISQAEKLGLKSKYIEKTRDFIFYSKKLADKNEQITGGVS